MRHVIVSLVAILALLAVAAVKPPNRFGGRALFKQDVFTDTPPANPNYPVGFYRGVNMAGPSVVLNGNTYAASSNAFAFSYSGAEVVTTGTFFPPVTGAEATLLETSTFNPTYPGTNIFGSVPAGTYLIEFWTEVERGGSSFTATINTGTVISNYFPQTYPGWNHAGPYEVVLTEPGSITIITKPSAARLAAIGIWHKIVNIVPNIAITVPAPAASFTAPATIAVRATALDPDGDVKRVNWYLNGTTTNASVGSGLFGTWTNIFRVLPEGSYTLYATATDDVGGVGTSQSVPFTVTAPVAPNVPPAITLTAPTNGQVYIGFLTNAGLTVGVQLTATATDADGTVAGVHYYAGSLLVGSSSSSPFSSSFNAYPGLYSIRGVATDNLGAMATSTVANITVTNLYVATNNPPQTTITYPSSGSLFTAPATLAVTASAGDPDGTVASVSLYLNNSLVGTDATAPYAWTVGPLDTGSYELGAVAVDNLGTNSITNIVSFTVQQAPVPNVPPTLSITSPTNGTSFEAPVTMVFAADAADSDGTIASVAFYRDSTLLATDSGAPYTTTITALGVGSYTLTAVATDNDGGKTTNSVGITVDPAANISPTVRLTAPANGTTYIGTTTIILAATAADTDGTIASVAFYRGATLLGTDVSSPYGETNAAVPVGDYVFTAIATDNDGATATNSVSIRIQQPANVPPTIAFSSPTNSTTFTVPATVPLVAVASDADGTVTSVSFYYQTNLIWVDATSPYTATNAVAAATNYTYYAVAMDNNGARSTNSVSASFVAAPPANVPPTVTITSPVNGYSTVLPATFTVAATAMDSDGTITNVAFYRASTLLVNDASAPYSYSDAGLGIGDYIYTAVASDDLGAKATNQVTAHVVAPPNILPLVTITYPTNGQTIAGLPLFATATATASDPDGSISQVAWWINSTVQPVDTTYPYTCFLAIYDAGTYTVTAVARDNVGGLSTNSVYFTVNPAPVVNVPPTVTVTSPTNGSSFTAPVTIPVAATAADSDGTIASVAFYRGAASIGTDSTAPYSTTDAGVTIGTYVYTAVATDDVGAMATNSVSVSVVNAAVPFASAGPDLSIQLPATATMLGWATNGVSNLWTKVSGPGTVTFGTSTATNTTAAFSSAGAYTLRLTAYGSANSVYDDANVTVLAVTPPVIAGTTTVTPVVTSVVLANPYKGFGPYADSSIPANPTVPINIAYQTCIWRNIEPTRGTINWSAIEVGWAQHTQRGNKIGFRIITCDPNYSISVPDWLVSMGVPMRNFTYSGGRTGVVQDWNNATFLAEHARMMKLVADHYNNDNRVAWVDIGSYGFYGEWHMYLNETLAGSGPSQISLVDHYLTNWTKKLSLGSTDSAYATAYIASKIGVGIRDDCVGDNAQQTDWQNKLHAAGVANVNSIYPSGLMTGEFCGGESGAQDAMLNRYATTLAFITTNHWAFNAGAGQDFNSTTDSTLVPRIQTFYKTMGYEYGVSRIIHSTNVNQNAAMTCIVTVTNAGVAPLYYNYPLHLSLCSSSGTVAFETDLSADSRLFLPGSTTITNSSIVPPSVAAGTYDVCFSMHDPNTDQPTIRLQNSGRDANGRYHLGTVTVTAAPVNLLLPVYLDGLGQPSQSRSVSLTGILPGSSYTLRLRGNHFDPGGKIGVSINNGAWTDIANTTVTVPGKASTFGGIGGQWQTMWVEIPVAAGVLNNGVNTINFRHNFASGNSTRRTLTSIIGIGIRDGSGSEYISTNIYAWQDPITGQDYTPLYTDDTAISNGLNMYQNKRCYNPALVPTDTQVSCRGCHTRYGWDWAYYAFPRPGVVGAAKRFGYTDLEAEQLYAYIAFKRRTADPNAQGTYYPWGRIWNPPYQPGPGMDSKPVAQWAAGAGIDAVLDDDSQMIPYMFPSGIVANSAKTYLNLRELPVAFQLPSIFQWYPTSHPLYMYGTEFSGSDIWKSVQGTVPGEVSFEQQFAAFKASGYANYPYGFRFNIETWMQRMFGGFIDARKNWGNDKPTNLKLYNFALWAQMQLFENMQEYGVEGHAAAPTAREARTWYDHVAFDVSPNILFIDGAACPMNDGTKLAQEYLTYQWYHVQFVLNCGNYSDGDGRLRNEIRPMDWGYTHGFVKGVQWDTPSVTQFGYLVMLLMKGMQIVDTGTTGGLASISGFDADNGWAPHGAAGIRWLVHPMTAGYWSTSTVSAANKAAICTEIVRYFMDKCVLFTNAEYVAAAFGPTSYVVPTSGTNPDGHFAEQLWVAIPRLRTYGCDAVQLARLKAWAAQLYPANNWAGL